MITIVMGKPGVGKSCYMALKCLERLKKNNAWYRRGRLGSLFNRFFPLDKPYIFANNHVLGIPKFTNDMMMNVDIRDAVIHLDEAGIEFNSRDHKSFSKKAYEFFATHRHYNLDIFLYVQYWDRLDIVIRQLVQEIIILQPSTFPGTFRARRVNCSIKVEDGELLETYKYVLFGSKWYRRKPAFPFFNSFSRKSLATAKIPVWGTLEKLSLRYDSSIYTNIPNLPKQQKKQKGVVLHVYKKFFKKR